jgi:hypothetical protein
VPPKLFRDPAGALLLVAIALFLSIAAGRCLLGCAAALPIVEAALPVPTVTTVQILDPRVAAGWAPYNAPLEGLKDFPYLDCQAAL